MLPVLVYEFFGHVSSRGMQTVNILQPATVRAKITNILASLREHEYFGEHRASADL
jgi:hypothetical protein